MDADIVELVRAWPRAMKDQLEAVMSDPRRKAAFNEDIMSWRLASTACILGALGEMDPSDGEIAKSNLRKRLPDAEYCALECMHALSMASLNRPVSGKLECCRSEFSNAAWEVHAWIERAILRDVPMGQPVRGKLID